jgi:NitT/TauT family transport system substrate-binding protein
MDFARLPRYHEDPPDGAEPTVPESPVVAATLGAVRRIGRTAQAEAAFLVLTTAAASVPPAAAPSAAASPAASPVASPSSVASPSAVAPAVATSATANAVTVRAAWVALTANQLLLPMAEAAGYTQKYGITIDLSFLNGSSNGIAGIVSHSLDVITASGSAVVGAQSAAQDLVMVLGIVNNSTFRVMAAQNIASMDDLKGKTVSVSKIGASADYFYWQDVIHKLGWSMNDLQFVNAGDVQGQIALLANGQVSASIMSPPNDVPAESAGAHMVFDAAKTDIPNVQSGLIVAREYLASQRPIVTSLAKAVIEAIHRWKTDPAFTKQVIGKALPSDNPRFTDVGYEAFVDVFPEQPFVSREGMQSVIEQVATQTPAAKDVSVDRCFDNSVIQELVDSGFIKQVYGD